MIRLWGHLRVRRRRQVALLVVLAFMVSFAELASIGSVIPFIAALISPEQLLGHPLIQSVATTFGITEPDQLVLPICLGFGLLGLIAALVRLLQVYANIRFTYGLSTELGTAIYRRTLYQPYSVHVERNSSEVINAISTKTSMLMSGVLLSIITLASSVFTTASILVGLILIDPVTTLSAFGGLGVLYAVILRYSRRRLNESSARISQESTKTIRVLQEGLGGIRDILINHSQEAYTEAYRKADQQLRIAQGFNSFIAQAPRFVIEGVAMVIMAVAAYLIATRPGGVASALPSLAALALGAQRLLPMMQQIFSSLVNIRGNNAPLDDVLELLDQPAPEEEKALPAIKLPFEHSIELRRVGFRYQTNERMIFENLSLTVQKGQKVGIIGKTGSGKSTFADILMGLLYPTVGELLVDGQPIDPALRRGWQAHLSHVPQSIFLVDGSVADNIALAGVHEAVDWNRLRRAARMANIASVIEAMPQGYDTRVGERGVKLSGGQRQRVGIARALYKNADVIVLDEATSALDGSTEQEVMAAIEGLDRDLTIIIIAHRLSTLQKCDIVHEIGNGAVVRSGTFAEIVEAPAK